MCICAFGICVFGICAFVHLCTFRISPFALVHLAFRISDSAFACIYAFHFAFSIGIHYNMHRPTIVCLALLCFDNVDCCPKKASSTSSPMPCETCRVTRAWSTLARVPKSRWLHKATTTTRKARSCFGRTFELAARAMPMRRRRL